MPEQRPKTAVPLATTGFHTISIAREDKAGLSRYSVRRSNFYYNILMIPNRDFKEATFCAMDEEKSLKISEKENSGPKQQ